MNGARGDPSAGLIRRLFRRGGVEAAPPSPDEARVIAVASGKGGTGKSFVATGLAVALARRNRVILVDCDYGLGNDHLLLGVSPERTLQDVLGRRVRALDAVVDTGLGPGLLPGGSGVTTMTELSDDELGALARALGDVARACDVLILDLAAGISAQSLLTMLAADEIVLVTNPEIAALTDAYALVKCLSRQVVQPPVGVVVNRVAVGEPELGQRTFLKLAEVAQRFSGYSIHSLGEIPDDPAVSQRRLGQLPLIASHPQCNVAVAIDRIAARLRGPGPAAGRPTPPLTERWHSLIPHRHRP